MTHWHQVDPLTPNWHRGYFFVHCDPRCQWIVLFVPNFCLHSGVITVSTLLDPAKVVGQVGVNFVSLMSNLVFSHSWQNSKLSKIVSYILHCSWELFVQERRFKILSNISRFQIDSMSWSVICFTVIHFLKKCTTSTSKRYIYLNFVNYRKSYYLPSVRSLPLCTRIILFKCNTEKWGYWGNDTVTS